MCAGRYLVFGTIGLCRMHTLGAEHLDFSMVEVKASRHCLSTLRNKTSTCCPDTFKVKISRYSKYELYLLYLAGVCGKKSTVSLPRRWFRVFPAVVFRGSQPLVPGFPGRWFQVFPAVGSRFSRPLFSGVPGRIFPGFPGSGLEKAPERWYSTEMSGARGFRAGPDAEPTVGTP